MANEVIAKLAVKIAADSAEFGKGINQANSQLTKFTNGVASNAKRLIAGFGLYEIGQGILEATGSFQKFEAVLTNSLGSNSAAKQALDNISKFALTTPFEIDEVTAAYVRWTNNGLQPTISNMKQVGDVASSLGAGFEQTAEAFKDLLVGQTKRLEEVGISAQQANGKIQLSFKGVNIEIEKNAAGVKKALETYSQLNGVLGSSEAVAKTLNGRISNLSDAWTKLLATIGQSNSGPIYGAVESLTNILTTLAHFNEELELDKVNIGMKDFRDLSKEALDYILDFNRSIKSQTKISDILAPISNQGSEEFFKNIEANKQTFNNLLKEEGAELEQINTLWLRYVERRLEAAKADNGNFRQGVLDQIRQQKESAERLLEQLTKFPNTYNGISGAIKAYKQILDETNLSEQASIDKIEAKIRMLESRLKPGLINELNRELQALREAQAAAFDPSVISSYAISIADLEAKIARMTKSIEEPIIAKVDTSALTKMAEVTKLTEAQVKSFAESYQAMTAKISTAAQNMQQANAQAEAAIEGTIYKLAESLGKAVSGQANFGDSLISSVASLAKEFGGLMIGMGITVELFKNSMATGNGYALAAAGAALVALGAAAESARKSAPSRTFGGGGGTSFSSGRSPQDISSSSAQDIKITGTAIIKGQDLWIAFENYKNNNFFTKPS